MNCDGCGEFGAKQAHCGHWLCDLCNVIRPCPACGEEDLEGSHD